MMCPENGAISEGFSTIVQPQASAGATLQAIWLAGQFQGVIRPQTPTGSRTMRVVPCCFSNSKSLRTPSATMKWPSPAGACCALAIFASGAPISSLIACAMSSRRRLYTSMIFAEQRHALLARGAREALEGALRGGDGPIHVGAPAERDHAGHGLGRRVDDVERVGRSGGTHWPSM